MLCHNKLRQPGAAIKSNWRQDTVAFDPLEHRSRTGWKRDTPNLFSCSSGVPLTRSLASTSSASGRVCMFISLPLVAYQRALRRPACTRCARWNAIFVTPRGAVLVTSSHGTGGHGTHLAADSVTWKGNGNGEWGFSSWNRGSAL